MFKFFLDRYNKLLSIMGKLIKSTTIERHIITREGQLDVHITLDLNLFINSKGEISIEARDAEPKRKIKDDDKVELELPDIEPNDEIIDFGK